MQDFSSAAGRGGNIVYIAYKPCVCVHITFSTTITILYSLHLNLYLSLYTNEPVEPAEPGWKLWSCPGRQAAGRASPSSSVWRRTCRGRASNQTILRPSTCYCVAQAQLSSWVHKLVVNSFHLSESQSYAWVHWIGQYEGTVRAGIKTSYELNLLYTCSVRQISIIGLCYRIASVLLWCTLVLSALAEVAVNLRSILQIANY